MLTLKITNKNNNIMLHKQGSFIDTVYKNKYTDGDKITIELENVFFVSFKPGGNML